MKMAFVLDLKKVWPNLSDAAIERAIENLQTETELDPGGLLRVGRIAVGRVVRTEKRDGENMIDITIEFDFERVGETRMVF